MPTYYCTPADIRNNVAGTDEGTGTCAAMPDLELNAAISKASTRVNSYTGTAYDPSAVPDLISDLTVQLATYYATLTYRKSRDLAPTDPVALSYADAMATLKGISSGNITVVPAAPDPGGPPPQPSAPRVINTVPGIFTDEDAGVQRTLGGRIEAQRARGAGWGWRGGW